MNRLLFVASIVLALLFSGCSSKKYFEPKTTFSASSASNSFHGKIIDLSRDGGTLDNNHYIGKTGINAINLGKGYRFLNENNSYALASNVNGNLKIINKATHKVQRLVSLHIPVVSASIKNGLVAYILNNNTFGIYDMGADKKIVESRSGAVFAIDTRAASPMFIENIVVVPMLDGKLIISSVNSNNAKVVYISSEPSFNNVIYLSRVGNTMVAATPKRLITIGNSGKLEYKANISEVAIANSNIYLFTKEGKILSLDSKLKVVATSKFKFAHYVAGTSFDGKVYALDQQGSLIVLNSSLNKFKIYDVGSVSKSAFISKTKLYKDGKVIELSRLGYR